MSYAKQMLDSYGRALNVEAGMLAATIDAVNDCNQACIRLCLECADVCAAALSGS